MVTRRRELNEFLQLPGRIYRSDPNWVSPLRSEVRRVLNERVNPYFRNASLKLFLCYEKNRVVARTSVVINKNHWIRFGEKTAFFGFFEAVDDPGAVLALFESVQRYCREAGVETLEGPFNPNHYSELGMQADGFGALPVFFETYNPSYYNGLLKNAGFRIAYTLHTRKNTDVAEYVRKRYGRITPPKSRGPFTVRYFNMHDIKGDIERIRCVNNDAFSDNWHFLPVTREECLFSAKFLRLVTYPELITFVEHQGEPVGVLQCVPDINPFLQTLRGKFKIHDVCRFLKQKKLIRDLVIYSVGIKKAFRNTRAYALLHQSMCWTAVQYQTLTTTWMSEENVPSIRASEHLGLVPYKRFHIYKKPVGEVRNGA